MNNLYIFAIGGTGARVLRSLTMLLAAGVKIPARRIVPIIIDPDRGNGNTMQTVELMRLYQNLYGTLAHDINNGIHAFGTELFKLDFPNDFLLPMTDNVNTSFSNYISLPTMSVENQAMTKMLFSEDNLSAHMDNGFLGNPNMGSVVLNQFTSTNEFKSFATAFSSNDGIFIISSIFGGTGASGFPLLLKNLRFASKDIDNAEALKTAKIGAISVMPYFRLDQGDKVISSDTFIQKTKAALLYYAENMAQLEALYYIGDTDQQPQANVKGGIGQCNKAHFIELASALAIIDYAEQWNSLGGTCRYKEFGISDSDSNSITLQSLSEITRRQIAMPLTEMTLAAKFVRDHLRQSMSTAQVWTNRYAQFRYADVEKFTSLFIDWLQEMADDSHGTKFTPYDLGVNNENVYGLAKGMKTKRVMSLASNWDLADDRLNSVSDNRVTAAVNNNNQTGQFLAHVMLAMQRLVSDKINLQ